MKLLVALPCYNEAEKIQKVIQEIPSSFEGIDERRILVVDDGSADETASLAHEAGAVVIRHKVNKGLGQTFRDAVEYAVVHGFDIMVNMDGDGQFNSQNIADLIAPILHNEADFVTGSRFMTGLEIPHMPPIKRWGNDRMTNLISRLCPQVHRRQLWLPRLQPGDPAEDQFSRPLHLHAGKLHFFLLRRSCHPGSAH